MVDILRFCKVTRVKNKTVAITGVNLSTGKHVEMVLSPDRINDSTLDTLKKAMLSNVFVKFSVNKDKFTVGNEDPSESYFLAFSFARKAGYNPPFLKKLDDQLVTMESWRAPVKDLGVYVLNLMDKLGNIYYARDQILRENSKARPSHPIVRYHIFNAVASCKACFDALAAILNEVYGIGHRKGKIDLASTRSDLIDDLKKVNESLGSVLEKFQSWINRITDYRDAMEHRIMLLTPLIAEAPGSRSVKCKVPVKPVYIGDPKMTLFATEEISYQDAENFCKGLIDNVTKLIEIVTLDLIQMISTRTYIPT